MSSPQERSMQDGPIQGCDDFQTLLPDYRASRLSAARRLLVEDHLRECVACRKADEGRPEAARERLAERTWWRTRWAVAAVVAVAAAVTAWFALRPSAGRITVESVDGSMYKVAQDQVAPVAPGAEVAAGGDVRTGKDSGAVIRLADGSTVEIRERTSFSVSELGGDSTIHLNRGAVIVEAAQRRFGRLRVATRDCSVSGADAVFSVDAGVRGSRVLVLRGEARLARGDERKTLAAGEQFATDASMTPVILREEIAWSKDAVRYANLLPDPAARQPQPRGPAGLLALLPAGTVFVASFPNSPGAAEELRKLVEQKAAQTPELREWLRSGRGGGREASAAAELLQAASAYLGPEIIMAATAGASGGPVSSVLLAEAKKPGLEAFLNERARQAGARGKLPLMVRDGVAALAGEGAAPESLLSGGFEGTSLYARIRKTRRGAAGLLVAADLERMARPGAATGSIQQAILEQKETAGRTDTQATLYFRDSNTGPAAWLAPPAPIGALDFVSPEATMAAGFVLKNPARALEELAASTPRIPAEIRELAPALGGEFALAFDGAGFPLMTWKIAAEVNDPQRLQAAIERLAAGKQQSVQLRQESFNGRTYYLLSFPGASQFGEAAYTYADGYILAAASRALVERALRHRASGFTLTRSSDFIQLAPSGSSTNFSGILYQNMGSTLGPLAEILAAGAQIEPEQKKAIRQFSAQLKPALVTLTGGAGSIGIASSSDLLGLNPARLASLSGPLQLLEQFTRRRGTSEPK